MSSTNTFTSSDATDEIRQKGLTVKLDRIRGH